MNLAEAVDKVLPFASTDETRFNLTKPAQHAAHVVATNGHILAAVRYDDPESRDERALSPGDLGAPRFEAILPATLERIGFVHPLEMAMLRHLPSKWACVVTLTPLPDVPYVTAAVPERKGVKGKILSPRIPMITREKVTGFDVFPAKPIGVDAGYLLTCLDLFEGAGELQLYCNGPLEPIVVAAEAAATRADLLALPGFAIVMPVRL